MRLLTCAKISYTYYLMRFSHPQLGRKKKKDNNLLGSQVLVRYWHEEITIKCKILFNIIGDVIITEDSMHSFFGACLQLTRLEFLVCEFC